MRKGACKTLTKPAADTLEKVQRWAGEATSIRVIARRLGMSPVTFRDMLEKFPDLQAAYDEGIEQEHQLLYTALLAQLDKSPVPAIFLLKTRHGYREGDQTEIANRVSVTFELPGAMPLAKFVKGKSRVIEHEHGDPKD